MSLREWLTNLFASRYVAQLERENARLLQENRALMNSLLGHVGCPPIQPVEAHKTPNVVRRPRNWYVIGREREVRSAVEARKANG